MSRTISSRRVARVLVYRKFEIRQKKTRLQATSTAKVLTIPLKKYLRFGVTTYRKPLTRT